MPTKKRKKRKWTEKEKKAFARRMKRARAAKSSPKKRTVTKKKVTAKKIKKRKTVRSTPKPSIKKKGVKRMAGKKASKKKTTRRRRKTSRIDFLKHARNAVIVVGGGVVAASAANRLPIKNPLLKAGAPALMGLGLIGTIGRKNPLAAQLGFGMLIMAGYSAIRVQFPDIPLLAGEDDEMVEIPDELLDDEDRELLGLDDDDILDEIDYYGEDDDDDDDLMGVEDFSGQPYSFAGANRRFITSADL